ncbi:FAD-binding protein [Carboxylicivirga mesophila]|uniref:FAD-binding protein n=1 Tax=Carboxylicivirga mesophila TaxID=1166478 RepID=A0ABS5K611_9BACT|nr:FAD-binding and (Fe-S)-binding domain-containing protein [Carboxylicivirga mesophila]MBS2210434.1 FAD-binding protein [Carboxylicivirga mesophila]
MKEGEYPFEDLRGKIKGRLDLDEATKIIYSTDASAYYEKPLGVVIPRDALDIKEVIRFAARNDISLIPRAAGTSLAGQVVGPGLVVDIGRYLNRILEVNEQEKWVRVEPGVVLDELNQYLEQFGLFFGPETSTSNRCMIGGMVGNNSCGAHSLIYGSTRDHTLELKGYLSNGDDVHFRALQKWEFDQKCRLESFEGDIYRSVREIISDRDNRKNIRKEFPHPEIKRRNTGYALDYLVESFPIDEEKEAFNFCKLLAGSEGTLMFTTEIKLNLVEIPPKEKGLVCVHLNSIEEALEANLICLKYHPGAIELMDKAIMDLTKGNKLQNKNRFFVEGDPAALLLVEFARDIKAEVEQLADDMSSELVEKGFGYAYPVVYGGDIKKVWDLRKAGLGVLANMPGDERPVPVIEDTAVRPEDLPAFIADIKTMLHKYGKECVYYAHIGTGELHLRPVLNMKREEDVELFYQIAKDTALIVKKYKGSLSGEHGDGRLRGQFIPIMVGESNYELFKQVKQIFDPGHVFNLGKITETPPMNTSLRYKQANDKVEDGVVFDWSSTLGMVRAAEKCSGSGDCRKSHLIGGTMCPSYMGSRDERQTTRARANMLREFFAGEIPATKLGYDEVKGVLDLCLSCKACKTECPSNVDMTKLKAEFLNSYHSRFGIPARSKLIANLPAINRVLQPFSYLYNKGTGIGWINAYSERHLGISSKRRLPKLCGTTLRRWHQKRSVSVEQARKVYLFADEFTNYNDAHVGICAVMLLEKLGYSVELEKNMASGRTYLSKGLVKEAARLANKNVRLLSGLIDERVPLIGLEPSAILTFRDEYIELVDEDLREAAMVLAQNTYTFEEFLAQELDKGCIDVSLFVEDEKSFRFHAHCYQKSLSDTGLTKKVLEIPLNYKANEIPSGCCGMAGSFGFEKEHYDLSMKIGELVLFPEVRKYKAQEGIVAAGTSCRHQIKDGTGVVAEHPAKVLFEALK